MADFGPPSPPTPENILNFGPFSAGFPRKMWEKAKRKKLNIVNPLLLRKMHGKWT